MARGVILGWKFLKVIQELPVMRDLKPPWFLYALSQHVIHGILASSIGPWPPTTETKKLAWDWITTHIHNGHHETEFLRCHAKGKEDQELHLIRVMEFAEALYNLQTVPEIETIYRRFIDNPSEFEPIMLELEGLKLLWMAGLKFKINAPGEGNHKIECSIFISDTLTAHCEMKCKLEDTQISNGSIVNALKHARKQLPRDQCGVVILKLPTSWGFSEESTGIIMSAVSEVLQGTSRIAEVILYQRDLLLTKEHSIYPIIYKEIINNRSPFRERLNGGILSHWNYNGMNFDFMRGWVPFSVLSTKENLSKLIESQIPTPPHR